MEILFKKATQGIMLRKQQNRKVPMNNAALGFDYKLPINMLMKKLCIAVQYCYVLNQITLEDNYYVVYAPSTSTKSEYSTKIIDWELIHINKLEINKKNSTKSIVSKQVRL